MEHLRPEALAQLVDELPSTEERLHLEGCPACQDELATLREQGSALSRLPDVRPPRGDWAALEARLVSEGLIDGGGRAGYAHLARTPRRMRAVAAVFLFLGGVGVGALGVGGGVPGVAGMGRPALAGIGFAAAPATSVQEAAIRVQRAERGYIDALTQYRALLQDDADPAADDPARRYAALEVLVQAGRAAVREAPADPFLNGFLASAMAEQRAVVRRISSTRDGNWF